MNRNISSRLRYFALILPVVLTCGLSAKVIDNYLNDNFPVLVPSVQKLEKTPGTYRLPEKLKVYYPKQAAHEFAVFSKNLTGRFSGRKALSSGEENADCKLIITTEGVPASKQGYTLSVRPDGITVKSRTAQGLFYGVVTLNQLVSKSTTTSIPCCEITDFPDLEERGIFFNLSKCTPETAAKFCKTIDNLGKLKINLLELDFGANLPFENTPFTNRKSTLSQADVQNLIAAAKRNYVEIMPHLQLLSHESWLRSHPQYMEKITSRRTKAGGHNSTWMVCTCFNSKLGREAGDFAVRETIRIFKPRRFNLSLDEFEVCKWRDCQFCGKNGHKIEDVVREATHYVNLVKSLGVTPYVYQDAMLPERSKNSVLAAPLMKAMPRTAGIAIWDYKAEPVRGQLEIFKKLGFKERLGVSFCDTLTNTMTLPVAIKETGCQGCILTYWGFVRNLYADPKMVNCNAAASTVIHAEFCWNADVGNDFHRASWDPAREYSMLDRSWKMPNRRHSMKYAPMPLANVCNGQFGADDCFPVLDKKCGEKLAAEAKRTIEGYQVNLTPEGRIAAVMLSGGHDSYGKKPVVIPVNNTVKGLSFLLTGGIPEDDGIYDYFHSKFMPEAFTLRINYADGTKKFAKVCYRLHFNNWNSESSGALSRFALRCSEKRGLACNFYSYDWNNPLPQREITSIELIPNLKKFSSFSGRFGEARKFHTGVPVAILAVTAWAPGRDFAPDGKIKSALPECTGVRTFQPANPNTVLTFKNGTPSNFRFAVEGEFTGKVTQSVVDTSCGKMLKVVIPSTVKDSALPRLLLDVYMTPPEKIGSVFFNCLVGRSGAINRCNAYLMNRSVTKCRNAYVKNNRRTAADGSLYVIPEAAFSSKQEHTPSPSPAETDTLRWSLWLNTLDKPLTVYFGDCGTTPEPVRWLSTVNRHAVE